MGNALNTKKTFNDQVTTLKVGEKCVNPFTSVLQRLFSPVMLFVRCNDLSYIFSVTLSFSLLSSLSNFTDDNF